MEFNIRRPQSDESGSVFRIYLDLFRVGRSVVAQPSEQAQKRVEMSLSSAILRSQLAEARKAREKEMSGYEKETAWVDFKRWSWAEKHKLREQCITRDVVTGDQTIETTKLMELKIKHLFVDWSLDLKDDEGNTIELARDPDGSLSQASMDLLLNSPELLPILEAMILEADAVLERGEPLPYRAADDEADEEGLDARGESSE